jgi:hypothetical protein
MAQNVSEIHPSNILILRNIILHKTQSTDKTYLYIPRNYILAESNNKFDSLKKSVVET